MYHWMLVVEWELWSDTASELGWVLGLEDK